MKLQRRAPRGSLARLVQRLSPGGRLVRMRRLRGGIGARMHVLEIEGADGARHRVSLRRFVRDHRFSTSEHVGQEFEILCLVESAGIAAPRPLLLDARGEYFGVPAMVLSYLPGAPLYTQRDERAWVEQLARALLTVHAVTPDRFDLSKLGVHLLDGMRGQLRLRADEAREHGALAREVHAALTEDLERIGWPEPCLVHDDYWPGNTVWYRGRLAGIIDWTAAEVGDPRVDVAQCRVDLTLIRGGDAADAFLAAYQALAPQTSPDVWYFDLHRGLGCLLSYEHWIEGYQDAGLTYMTSSLLRERVEAFLRRALGEREKSRA